MTQSDLDQEFINTMLSIEQNYGAMNKHQRIRIELWTKKLCQVTTNDVWKKNRNFYAKILLQQVQKNILAEPFDKRPPEGPLPKLNKYQIISQTSALQKENRKSVPKQEYQQPARQSILQPRNNRSRSKSPYDVEEPLDVQNTVNLQEAQIQQLTQFNEKLVRHIMQCRQYLDPLQDAHSMALKNEQDNLFQWMHDQSQQLFNPQYQPQQGLEQIEEIEEDNDMMQYQDNTDLIQYLEKFEQKGVLMISYHKNNLKNLSQQMMGGHFGQPLRYDMS